MHEHEFINESADYAKWYCVCGETAVHTHDFGGTKTCVCGLAYEKYKVDKSMLFGAAYGMSKPKIAAVLGVDPAYVEKKMTTLAVCNDGCGLCEVHDVKSDKGPAWDPLSHVWNGIHPSIDEKAFGKALDLNNEAILAMTVQGDLVDPLPAEPLMPSMSEKKAIKEVVGKVPTDQQAQKIKSLMASGYNIEVAAHSVIPGAFSIHGDVVGPEPLTVAHLDKVIGDIENAGIQAEEPAFLDPELNLDAAMTLMDGFHAKAKVVSAGVKPSMFGESPMKKLLAADTASLEEAKAAAMDPLTDMFASLPWAGNDVR